jgi:hypothetical protein
MAKYFAIEATRVGAGKAPGSVVGAQLKRHRATFVSTGTNTAAADVLGLGFLPMGAVFAFGLINGTVASGATTIAIGNATTAGKYRAAAALAAADTPSMFGTGAQVAAAAAGATVEEEVLATLSAALPAGTFVIDIYYSGVAS